MVWADTQFTSPHIRSIWTNDTIPVYHMTYLPPQHVVFAKCTMLIVVDEEGNPPPNKGNPLILTGVHSLPISGKFAALIVSIFITSPLYRTCSNQSECSIIVSARWESPSVESG